MNEQTQNKRPGRTMGWVCRIFAIITVILIITSIILGYFISYVGHDGDMRDGLGRLLDMPVPGGLSLILRQWAGYIWFFIDCIVLFALVILTDRLLAKSKTYFTGTKHVDF